MVSQVVQSIRKRATLKEDLIVAFSIALVTIPLSIGISVASGVPATAGIFAAIIGGIVATFLRGSHLTINGPAASLIVITLSTVQHFGAEDPIQGFRIFLAASLFAGALLIILGLLRIGRYGDLLPGAIIYGIIGAIGLMILTQQIPVALGIEWEIVSPIQSIMEIPDMFISQNPFVGLITFVGFLFLIGYNYLKNKWVKMIPAPVWVIGSAVLLAWLLGFQSESSTTIFSREFNTGPDLLVQMPQDIWSYIIYPDFSQLNSIYFWQTVIVITLIVSIETMISAKAMDRIDPLRRQTNLNRDLIACGVSTCFSSCIGGLPVITAVPLYHGGRTKAANFFQGVLILLFLLFLPFLINGVPLAALATLLIFTGYKLASPKIFLDTYRLGFEQFVVLAVTLIVILFQGVLLGTILGFMAMLFIQLGKSSLSRKQFLSYIVKPDIKVEEEEDNEIYIKTGGIINYMNILALKNTIRTIKSAERVVLDMSDTRLVDSTVLEYLHEEVEKYDIPSIPFDIVGLDAHETSSRHPNAMHVLPENKKPQLTKRQQALEELAEKYDGTFWPEVRWEVSSFRQFNFFQTRPIEYKLNMAKGNYRLFLEWESCDITFEQGTLFNAKERHTTVILIHLPFNAPVFILSKESSLDRLEASLSFYKDIDFESHPEFSAKYVLRGPNEEEIRNYFNKKLLNFLQESYPYYIESNGTMLMIIKDTRFASPFDMSEMHEYSSELSAVILANWKEQAMQIKL